MRHRHAQLAGRAARQGDQIGQLLRRELARAAAALLIAEHLDDGGLQHLIGLRGRGCELLARLGEPLSPARHPLRVDAQLRRHVDGRASLGALEHDLHALGEAALERAQPAKLVEDVALRRKQLDRGSASTHAATLIPSIPEVKYL